MPNYFTTTPCEGGLIMELPGDVGQPSLEEYQTMVETMVESAKELKNVVKIMVKCDWLETAHRFLRALPAVEELAVKGVTPKCLGSLLRHITFERLVIHDHGFQRQFDWMRAFKKSGMYALVLQKHKDRVFNLQLTGRPVCISGLSGCPYEVLKLPAQTNLADLHFPAVRRLETAPKTSGTKRVRNYYTQLLRSFPNVESITWSADIPFQCLEGSRVAGFHGSCHSFQGLPEELVLWQDVPEDFPALRKNLGGIGLYRPFYERFVKATQFYRLIVDGGQVLPPEMMLKVMETAYKIRER